MEGWQFKHFILADVRKIDQNAKLSRIVITFAKFARTLWKKAEQKGRRTLWRIVLHALRCSRTIPG